LAGLEIGAESGFQASIGHLPHAVGDGVQSALDTGSIEAFAGGRGGDGARRFGCDVASRFDPLGRGFTGFVFEFFAARAGGPARSSRPDGAARAAARKGARSLSRRP